MKLGMQQFTGKIPRLPSHLLPKGAAQEAENCEFAYGSLLPLRGDFLLLNTQTNPVKGLYTPDGLRYLTWAEDVDAVASPVVGDEYGRVYFTTSNGFYVTLESQASATGGPPALKYKVGVPTPAAAPTVQVIERAQIPDNIVLRGYVWYEKDGVAYQEQSVSLTTEALGRQYTFNIPARQESVYDENDELVEEGTPEGAVVCLRIVGEHASGGEEYFRLYSSNSVNARATNAAYIPGGAELTLSNVSETTMRARIRYGDAETQAYVYRYVNQWGEQGAASLATVVTRDWMQKFRLTLPNTTESGYAPVLSARVYRSGPTDYQFMEEKDFSGKTQIQVDDTYEAADLGEVLSGASNYPPPQDLQGLMMLPNGIMAAWRNHELHFSEAYQPHAWNPDNTMSFGGLYTEYNVVAAAATGQGAVIATTAFPFFVSGVSPDAMSQYRIPVRQAGVNKHAITDMGDAVVYASHDGLVLVTGTQASLQLSQRLFTREVWRGEYQWDLGNLHLAAYDGDIIGYFPDRTGFVIRLDEAGGSLSDLTIQGNADFVLPQTDGLYIARGSSIYQYKGGERLTMTWQSGDMIMRAPTNFGALQVITGDVGTVTAEVYADGVKKFSQQVTSDRPMRLPGGFLARRWSIGFTGDGAVKECYMATTARELRGV